MPPKVGRRILLVAVAATFLGCSDNPTGPGSSNVPDVSALLAEISSSTLSTAAAIVSPRFGPAMSSASVDPGKCQYSATSGFFECPTATINGLTYSRRFRLIDDAGNSQSKPDTHTSAFETETIVEGTISTSTPAGPGGISSSSNYTIHATGDETLSGLQTSAHILNGASVMSFNGTMQLGTDVLPIDQTISTTTTNLVLPNAKKGQRFPQSGTMTIEVTGSSGSSKVVISFDGTSVVTITSTFLGSTTTCHVDLTNPAAGLAACQ